MGGACTRPSHADSDAPRRPRGSEGSIPGASRRTSANGCAEDAGAPVRQPDAAADWELLTDAAKLAAAAALPPETIQRYWLKARDGNFHPDEFPEPHVVAVLARCGTSGRAPDPLRAEGPPGAAAPPQTPDAPPALLGYAVEYSLPGAGASAGAPAGGAAAAAAVPSLLVITLRSTGSLDALAACDADARGTLVPLPAAWQPAGASAAPCVHAAFLAAARGVEAAAAARARAHLRACGPGARVLLTGHGTGAAAAAVLALALAARHPRCVWWAGFGAPRPGDAAFAAAFASAVGLRACVKHGRDPSTKLPAGGRFAPAGEPLHCGRDDPYEDLPVMSDLGDHELPRYLAALSAGRPASGLPFGLPAFELESLAPQRALASLANESYKAFRFWGAVSAEVGAAAGAAVAAVPTPPALALPPALGDLLAALPGGAASSAASTPAGTPRGAAADDAAHNPLRLVPPPRPRRAPSQIGVGR